MSLHRLKRFFLSWISVGSLALIINGEATHRTTTPISSQPPLVDRNHHLLNDIYRFLALGDFDSVNTAFNSFTIQIPNVTIEDRILGIGLTLDLYNIRCSDLHIGDVTLTSNKLSATSVDFLLNVIQLDTTCDLDYDYTYGFLRGTASVVAFTDDSSMITNILISQSSALQPPTDFEVSTCSANVEVTELDFSGGIVANILDRVDGLIRGILEDQLDQFLCEFIADTNGTSLNFLATIAEALDPYLNETRNEPLDPLAAEKYLIMTDLDANETLIDLLGPQTSIGVGVTTLLQEASGILGGTRDDSGSDLGINIIVREFIVDENGQFELDLVESNILDGGVILNSTGNMTETLVQLQGIRLQGLDSFDKFSPFETIGQYTLQANVSWEALYLELDLLVELGSADSDAQLREDVTLVMEMDDIDVDASFLLALKSEELGNLQVGSLFNTSAILDCFASTISALNFTSLSASVGSIKEPKFLGFESPGLDRVLTELVDGAFHLYDEVLLRAMPSVFQRTLRTLLNNQLAGFTFDAECPPPPSFTPTHFIDFRDLFYTSEVSTRLGASGTTPYGDLGSVIRTLVDTELLAANEETGLPEINGDVIAPLTELQSGTSGTLRIERNILDVNGNINFGSLNASIIFEASNVSLENLDTLHDPLVLVEPDDKEPYQLNNNLTMGLRDNPFRLVVRLLLAIEGNGVQIKDEFDLSLRLTDVNVVLNILMKAVANRLMTFPVQDLANLDCWLAMIPAPELDKSGVRVAGKERMAGVAQLRSSFSDFRLGVNCVDCTSPGLDELSRLLGTPQGMEDSREAAIQLLDYALRFLDGEFLQIIVDRQLAEAPKRCPHSQQYDPAYESVEFEPFEVAEREGETLSLLVVLAGTIFGLILVVVLLGLLVRFFVRRRHNVWIQTLPEETVFRILKQQRQERRTEDALRDSTSSMFRSAEVPCIVRYLIPVVLVANIGLFVSGHVNIGGAIDIYIRFAGEEIRVQNVMDFSIASSAIQLWEAGGTTLAIFILIFSGVWPYTKQIITLVAWFLPPTKLSVSRRGSIFLWLDSLAKWSTVDIFFLIVSDVAFQINVQSPDYSYLPEEFYEINAMLVIKWGLYANMIAQLLSQISSHFIIHYHRKVVESGRRSASDKIVFVSKDDQSGAQEGPVPSLFDDEGSQPPQKDRLHGHEFKRPHRGDATGLRTRPWVNSCFSVLAIFIVGLVIAGSILPSFAFEQLGVVGVIVELGRNFQDAINEFSVFSVASALVNQARFLGTAPDYVGLVAIAILFVLTVFCIPLILVILLLCQWFAPMTSMQRNRLEVAIETLHSWQYLDVFLVALVVSSWQLGPTSEFLVNTYCEGLQGAFNAFEFYGILSSDDAQCFQLRSSIETGCYLLIASALLLSFSNLFVTRAVEQYQRDSRVEEDESVDTDTIRLMSELNVSEAIKEIQPTPELFSDNFRWMLMSGSGSGSGSTETGEQKEIELGADECSVEEGEEPIISNHETDQRRDIEQSSFVDEDLDAESL